MNRSHLSTRGAATGTGDSGQGPIALSASGSALAFSPPWISCDVRASITLPAYRASYVPGMPVP